MSSLAATPLAAGTVSEGTTADVRSDAPTAEELTYVGEDDDPGTEETIGYVEGVRYDDDLPVDDRGDAVVPDDELEAVVYRSMARVEVIRELPFEDDVPVEVITREQFVAESAGEFTELGDDDRRFENVRLEALFMVDRETDAVEAYESLYGDAVGGYYDIEAAEIVLVSEDTAKPELDEVTLGHELLHALQDQHFGLGSYERETTNQDHAALGLIEGDAVWVDTRYEEYCEHEWDCILPDAEPDPPEEFNVGIYLSMLQPYNDGPDYVEATVRDGGWDAVDATYDDPPASSSEVIRPGEDREPVEVDLEDASSGEWERIERADAPDHDTFGEATLASMFMGPTVNSFMDPSAESSGPEVLGMFEVMSVTSSDSPLNYDHGVTDGWAGDEFVAYTASEGSETAFVWQSEWTDEAEANAFQAGYRELLEYYGDESIDGDASVFVVEETFPGAYYLEQDGETVTVVRAPSVDELSDVHDRVAVTEDEEADDPGERTDDVTDHETDDTPGFGVPAVLAALLALLAIRGRS
ncbi:Hvo_1808 family surface protein [Natrialbaceae archaeon A-gly3]